MPSVAALSELAQEALILSIVVSLPVVALSALAGLVVAVLQAATQVQDITLAHLPRLLVVALGIVLVGPWMGAEITAFAARIFAGGG